MWEIGVHEKQEPFDPARPPPGAQTRAPGTRARSKHSVWGSQGTGLVLVLSLFPSLISFCWTSLAERVDSVRGRDTQMSPSHLMPWPSRGCWLHFCFRHSEPERTRKETSRCVGRGFQGSLSLLQLFLFYVLWLELLSFWKGFVLKNLKIGDVKGVGKQHLQGTTEQITSL